MKNYKVFFIIFFLAFGILIDLSLLNEKTSVVSFVEEDTKKNIIICIDPGHQEKGDKNLEQVAPGSSQKKPRVSQGATGIATKKPEYVLNLEASLILKDILQKKGYNVIMTRESHNVNISNSERAIFANQKNANFVIRVHADSLNDSSKTGASILIPSKDNSNTTSIYEVSSDFANLIKESMENSGIKVNGIFERNDITGFNWSKVPVVILEMGFLSNYNEDLMMSDKNYQNKMMESVANGIDKYFNK